MRVRSVSSIMVLLEKRNFVCVMVMGVGVCIL
jgi:hypothetical protein